MLVTHLCVLLRDTHNTVVVSVAFRRCSLPFCWLALNHRGQSGLADQQQVLSEALALLPDGVRVSVHGNSEFRSQDLFAWLRERGAEVMLGIPGYILVAETPDGPARSLESWLPKRDSVAYLNGMYVTGERCGPVNVLAWWDRDAEGKMIVRGVMTYLKATWQTCVRGKRRMWIETVFRDWQSGGFHLDQGGIVERERFERLLIPLVLAYVWLVAVGRWVVKRGYCALVDDGPALVEVQLVPNRCAWKSKMPWKQRRACIYAE